MKTLSKILLTLVLVFSQTVALSEPPNLNILLSRVIQYHDSGEYDAELKNTITKAHKTMLIKAEELRKKNPDVKLAIVLDIDETSISNYKDMVKRFFSPEQDKIHQEYMQADAPAIPYTLDMYEDALSHGISVFFVTGRREFLREATIKNLKGAGFDSWERLYLKPNDYNAKSITPYKSKARKEITELGYTIIVNMGDQNSDIDGGYAVETFKLPNPYYYLP